MLTGFDKIKTGLTSRAAANLRAVHAEIQNDGPVKSAVLERHHAVTGVEVRAIVSFLRAKGYLVCSNQRGYFIPKTRDELDETIHHLEQRARSLLATAEAMKAQRGRLP